jgi:hypothetical protein
VVIIKIRLNYLDAKLNPDLKKSWTTITGFIPNVFRNVFILNINSVPENTDAEQSSGLTF